MNDDFLAQDQTSLSYHYAIRDFHRARRLAKIEKLKAFFTGSSPQLLPYEDVVKTLKVSGYAPKRLKEIPLDAIIGSVGRYHDFSRSFLPTQDFDEHRWVKVQVAFTSPEGVPPIEVYQIDDVYFVIDGNHRVSVARQLGAEMIEAYVTEIKSAIPFTPDTQPDDLIIKAEYKEFLKHTRLDELRPDADFSLTVPGKYDVLEKQVAGHCFALLDHNPGWTLDQAILDWYKKVYKPVIKTIREQGLVRGFPGRTETDLYVWFVEHREELEDRLGWQIRPETALVDFVSRSRPGKLRQRLLRARGVLTEFLIPDEFDPGPETGIWRRERMIARREDRMFSGILTPISGEARSWCALEQALIVAQREESHLYGLHVVAADYLCASEQALFTKAEFEERCWKAQIPADFVIEAGNIPRTITKRVRWTDLAVINLVNPPGKNFWKRLRSPFRTVVRQSSRPILAVPKTATALARPLLAYDGSPKATEALYLSAYLAAQWRVPLTIIFVQQPHRKQPNPFAFAEEYLQKMGLTATFLEKTGATGKTICATADEQHCDLIVMGGYDDPPLRELVFGSNVEKILRRSQLPLLICR